MKILWITILQLFGKGKWLFWSKVPIVNAFWVFNYSILHNFKLIRLYLESTLYLALFSHCINELLWQLIFSLCVVKIVFIIVFLFTDLSNTFNEHNGIRTAIFVSFQKWSNKTIILKLLESESYLYLVFKRVISGFCLSNFKTKSAVLSCHYWHYVETIAQWRLFYFIYKNLEIIRKMSYFTPSRSLRSPGGAIPMFPYASNTKSLSL